jgi:hypothetical protein
VENIKVWGVGGMAGETRDIGRHGWGDERQRRPEQYELEEWAIVRTCTRALLRALQNSSVGVGHYNSNDLGVLAGELEREKFYPERVFTAAHYTRLCTCVRELCGRMGARECTEAFPTWQYVLGAFRARVVTVPPAIVHAGSAPPQAAMQRLREIADS